MSEKKKKKSGLDYKQTFLIGFGFLACMLFWSIYNSYVPLILTHKLEDMGMGGKTILGFITVPLIVNAVMTIDNIFGVIFQPMFGKISDRTHSKLGKRMPFILKGLPICAVCFTLIPILSRLNFDGWEIALMMLVIIVFNFTMSTWRSPVVAMMPDYTPSELQSDGNAVINIMGGVGQALGFLLATVLGFVGFKEAISSGNYISLFASGAVLALIFMGILYMFVKKNAHKDLSAKEQAIEDKADDGKPQQKIKIKNLDMSKAEKKSLLFCLAALFFICNASEALVPNFTVFAEKALHVENPMISTIMMLVFALSLAGFAVPAGILGRKWGRKKTISMGLIVVVIMFAIYIFVAMVLPAIVGEAAWLNTAIWVMLWIALVAGGGAMAMVNINTLPIVLAMGGRDLVGTFTGYYYTATFAAAITGPILCGGLIGLFGNNYNAMFLFCAVAFLIGLLLFIPVKHGEVSEDDEAWLEEAVEAASDD